jgi:hypothetical protein
MSMSRTAGFVEPAMLMATCCSAFTHRPVSMGTERLRAAHACVHTALVRVEFLLMALTPRDHASTPAVYHGCVEHVPAIALQP